LLEDYAENLIEFQCDVAKASHHGSNDVSFEFLKAMSPAVTVISSGDSESFDHPRPNIVSACAVAGYQKIEKGRIISPLVYSTEIARSYKLSRPSKLTIGGNGGLFRGEALKKCLVEYKNKDKKARTKNLKDALMVTGLVYGLVNIRTDGKKILCATMNEANHTWNIHTISARF
jgi:hypothetical protein